MTHIPLVRGNVVIIQAETNVIVQCTGDIPVIAGGNLDLTASGTMALVADDSMNITVNGGASNADITISSGDFNGGTGGKIKLIPGQGSSAANAGTVQLMNVTGTATWQFGPNDNVAIGALCADFQSMTRGVFLANATAVPVGNPANGVFMWSEAGAGKARGTGGTVTTWAPAEPHCQRCGRDCALEWSNESSGWHIAVCMWCLTDALGNAGVIEKTS